MKKVLLVTNSEYGQANVFLAVGHALQAQDPEVQIHFASFAAISKEVASASAYSVQCTNGARPWQFHELGGLSFWDATAKNVPRTGLDAAIEQPPTFIGTVAILKQTMNLLLPWEGPDFVNIYQSFVRLNNELQPDIIAVDSLFAPVLTACRQRNLKHLVFSPNTLKDFSAVLQPWGAMFWKFPVMGSALGFPVPLRYIPANIAFCFLQIFFALTDSSVRALTSHVKRELGADIISFETLMMRPLPGQKILVANRPEIDFPLIVPGHLTACGPVIRPVPSVADVDPELEAWLKRGPTVFVCLGTHRVMIEEEAVEMAGALKQLLDAAAGEKSNSADGASIPLQIIWKLKKKPDHEFGTGPGSEIHAILGEYLDSDRVRIVDWVKPQPSAVLQTGSVVCSVNHGGANSFHDALTCGVPQVSLPPWLDCYDFASRTEVLGIGRWGNKQAMPRCTARELGPVLIDVVLGPEARVLKTRARELAALCAKSPGVSVAAAAILEEVEDRKTK